MILWVRKFISSITVSQFTDVIRPRESIDTKDKFVLYGIKAIREIAFELAREARDAVGVIRVITIGGNDEI